MKPKIIIPAFLILVPAVLAQSDLTQGILNGLNLVFGTAEQPNILFVKLALWLIAFSGIFKASARVFYENKATAVIVSFLITTIGLRFMPASWFEWAGPIMFYIWIVALLLAPYWIISRLFGSTTFGKILTAAAYVGIFFGLTKLNMIEFGAEYEFLNRAASFMSANRTLVTAAGFLVALVFIAWLSRRKHRLHPEEYKAEMEAKLAKKYRK